MPGSSSASAAPKGHVSGSAAAEGSGGDGSLKEQQCSWQVGHYCLGFGSRCFSVSFGETSSLLMVVGGVCGRPAADLRWRWADCALSLAWQRIAAA